MKKVYKIENGPRLTAYSVMAVSVIATLPDSKAEIIYNDIEDTNIEVGGTFDIDLDGDGIMDFHFRASSTVNTSSGGVWSFGSVFGNATSYSVGNVSNQLIGYVGSFYNYGSALSDGDNIGPTGPWLNYPSSGNSAVLASNFYGATYGAFPGAGEKFLGLKFANASGLHYGWMRISADVDPVVMTILDYAYENTADAAIDAGDETGGSISTIDLPTGAVQIYSFNNIVNIINKADIQDATVLIRDISGQLLFSVEMNLSTMQVNLSQYAAGNYFVQVQSPKGSTTEQVFIN